MLRFRGIVIACAFLACQSGRTSGPDRPAAAALPAPARLSPTARDVLHRRMARHGDEMQILVHTVLMLDDRGTADLASSIAANASLARPLSGDATELNVQLPLKFFMLQDEQRRAAKELAAAAERHDRAGVASAFGTLARTCVQCHAVYLEDEGSPAPR